MRKWIAMQNYWDGSKEEDGQSGCGIVIKAVTSELDHNQQNCSVLEHVYSHGCAYCRS